MRVRGGWRGRRAKLAERLTACMRKVFDPKLREALRRLEGELLRGRDYRMGRTEERKLFELVSELPSIAARGLDEATGHCLKQIEEHIRKAIFFGERRRSMGILDRFRQGVKRKGQSREDARSRGFLEESSQRIDGQLQDLEQRIVQLLGQHEDLTVQLNVLKHDASQLDPGKQEYMALRMKALLISDKVKTVERQIGQYRDMLLQNHRYRQMMAQGLVNIDLKKYVLDVPEAEVLVKGVVDGDEALRLQSGDIGEIFSDGERALEGAWPSESVLTAEEALFDREIEEMAKKARPQGQTVSSNRADAGRSRAAADVEPGPGLGGQEHRNAEGMPDREGV